MNWLEDFAPGQVFGSASATIEDAAIRDFAASFDPQPAHLDPAAAASTVFRGLAASGWHTAALTMRLLVDSDFRPQGGIVGLQVAITWSRPVRPGDRLHLRTEVLEARPSRLRPGQGTLRVQVTTFNQDDQPVQVMEATLRVPSRAA